MGDAKVAYICRAHHDAGRRDAVRRSPFTVYDGRWAYCAAGAVADHAWEEIEPVDIATLKLREVSRREAV